VRESRSPTASLALDTRNQYFISTHNPYSLLPILEKAPSRDVAVFATYYRDHETRVKELGEEEREEVLGLKLDALFNIERLCRNGFEGEE